MTIRKLFPLLLVAAATHVVAFAVLANPVSAQGLGCGWCWHWTHGSESHAFIGGRDLCGLRVYPFSEESCARCSRAKGCHTDWDPGPCHLACGPAGDDMTAIDVIHETLEARDLGAFVAAVDGAPATLGG